MALLNITWCIFCLWFWFVWQINWNTQWKIEPLGRHTLLRLRQQEAYFQYCPWAYVLFLDWKLIWFDRLPIWTLLWPHAVLCGDLPKLFSFSLLQQQPWHVSSPLKLCKRLQQDGTRELTIVQSCRIQMINDCTFVSELFALTAAVSFPEWFSSPDLWGAWPFLFPAADTSYYENFQSRIKNYGSVACDMHNTVYTATMTTNCSKQTNSLNKDTNKPP